MAYDYMEAMRKDIAEYIKENVDRAEYDSTEDLYEKLYDDLWLEDSVTGNASGSYTFNSARAREYVTEDGEGYLREAVDDFGIDAKTLADKFLSGEWEWFDVTIRCYLLGQVLQVVIDELDEVMAIE